MKIGVFKDSVFNLAILLSIAWHIFWLSIITVVVTPKETKPIKFSKVSFLGPILERGALEVRIEPRERSFLEKRYLINIGSLPVSPKGQATYQEVQPIKDMDEKLINLIEEVLSGTKIEPPIEISHTPDF